MSAPTIGLNPAAEATIGLSMTGVALAISASGAPVKDFKVSALKLVAEGVDHLGGIDAVKALETEARHLNLRIATPLSARQLAADWSLFYELWETRKRMQAATDAAWRVLLDAGRLR